MSKTLARVLLLTSLVLLGGCSQWYFTLGTPLDEVELPTVGDGASMGDVLDILGPPQRMSRSASGFVFAWEYWEVNENAFGINLSALGADFLSLDFAQVDSRGEFLLATFDHAHQLSSLTRSEWDSRLGDGKALQPLGIYDVATTGDLVQGVNTHYWGASMLGRLPRTLNSGSDLDSGENGIEQRATPNGLGQRTLEMD